LRGAKEGTECREHNDDHNHECHEALAPFGLGLVGSLGLFGAVASLFSFSAVWSRSHQARTYK
jgi:hypothetical protein